MTVTVMAAADSSWRLQMLTFDGRGMTVVSGAVATAAVGDDDDNNICGMCYLLALCL
jgi:hypothetical protein